MTLAEPVPKPCVTKNDLASCDTAVTVTEVDPKLPSIAKSCILILLPLWGGVSEHQYCTLISTRCQVEVQRFYKFIPINLHDATPALTRIRSTESQHRSRRSARPRIICEIMRAPSATIRKRPATIACGAFFGVRWYVESCRKAMRQNRS